MEQIIGIIIMIALGLAGKWIEDFGKKKKSSETDADAGLHPSVPAFTASTPPPPPVAAPQPAPRKPKPKAAKPKAVKPQPPKPVVHHEPVAPKPLAGDITEPQFAAMESTSEILRETDELAAERNRRLLAHYDRWRQAIIDAQIIPPKFKD